MPAPPRPITQLVLDIVIALLIAAILVAIVAAIFVVSGGTLGWQAAAVLLIVGTSVFFSSGDAYAGTRDACCIVKPIPHKGGDPIHNRCADLIGPNDHPGMDAQVDGKAFDAMTGNAVLWEVKTHNYANCATEYCRAKLWPMWVLQARAEISVEAAIAAKCSYAYTFAVGDQKLSDDVGYFPTVIRPDICLQPTVP